MAWWKEEPWRMIQTNLREIDMLDISADQYVRDIMDFHASVVLINAAGISASYDTKLSFQKINPYLKGDSLKKITERCHENGIRVLARTDFSKVPEDIISGHPDWAYRTRDGKMMNYNGYVQTCVNSGYQQEKVFEILEELFKEIPFDGLYCNMGGFQTQDYDFKEYGFCCCERCRSAFLMGYGAEIPSSSDPYNPDYVKYRVYKEQTLSAYRKRIAVFLKSLGKDICFDDVDFARIESSTEIKRRLPHWQYHASSNCRAILGDGSSPIICSNTSVDYQGYALRHVSVSPQLQALRLWQNLANLGALDYYLIGRTDRRLDRSGFKKIKEIFSFHEKYQHIYKGLVSFAKVLLLRADRWVATEEEKGWIRVLTECHIPFSEILRDAFLRADLSRYELLIIPDKCFLSEEEAGKTDAYAASGGSVILVGETGLADTENGRRSSPMVRCTGITEINRIGTDMISAMFLLGKKDKDMFVSYADADTDVIPVGDTYVYCHAGEKVERYCEMIGPHPYGPPECCCHEPATGWATATPMDLSEIYWSGCADSLP